MLKNKESAQGSSPSGLKKTQTKDGGMNIFAFNNNYKTFNFQCKKCRSEDGKFQKENVCIRCQQRVEFIVREYPKIAAKVTSKAGGVR